MEPENNTERREETPPGAQPVLHYQTPAERAAEGPTHGQAMRSGCLAAWGVLLLGIISFFALGPIGFLVLVVGWAGLIVFGVFRRREQRHFGYLLGVLSGELLIVGSVALVGILICGR